jgi:tyrosyl-tRNA synthetase
MKVEDADVVRFLQYFTFLDEARVRELADEVARAPERREAQRLLAREVTTFVHGSDECARAERASQALFGGELLDLDLATLEALFADAPTSSLAMEPGALKLSLVQLLVDVGVVASKGAARREIEQGGVYLNNRQQRQVDYEVTSGDLLAGRVLVLRKGKRNYHLVRVGG